VITFEQVPREIVTELRPDHVRWLLRQPLHVLVNICEWRSIEYNLRNTADAYAALLALIQDEKETS
jgi:hypothetical protein